MEDLKLHGYHEIWKRKLMHANLKNAAGIRNTQGFKDSHNVDLIRQRSDDKYVRLYGKPTSTKHIKIWKNRKPKEK